MAPICQRGRESLCGTISCYAGFTSPVRFGRVGRFRFFSRFNYAKPCLTGFSDLKIFRLGEPYASSSPHVESNPIGSPAYLRTRKNCAFRCETWAFWLRGCPP